MSDDAALKKRTIDALRRYREALAAVERLEQEDTSAHGALTSVLPNLERAILESEAPSFKDSLFETGSAVASRSNEAWSALSEATARLEVARKTLIGLERQLGHIPNIPMAANPRDIRRSPNGGY